jgi:hypothetical protein
VDFGDGKSHPVTGAAAYDAISLKTVNDSTIWGLRTKAGKVVQTLVLEVSADGKSHTSTITGVTADGRALNDMVVYDKQ